MVSAVRSKKPTAEPVDAVELPTVKVHPVIVGLVAFHVIAITIYSLPQPSKGILDGTIQPRMSDYILKFNQQELKNWAPIYGYCAVTGMWQYWDMFAPDPAQTDIWCSAEVTYMDGTKKPFEYPHMKALSIPQKFMLERHRKYFERVNQPGFSYLWVTFGQAIAFKSATDPNNPPIQVDVTRHFQEVVRHDAKDTSKENPYGQYTFFRYAVDLNKLYSDKGWKLGVH